MPTTSSSPKSASRAASAVLVALALALVWAGLRPPLAVAESREVVAGLEELCAGASTDGQRTATDSSGVYGEACEELVEDDELESDAPTARVSASRPRGARARVGHQGELLSDATRGDRDARGPPLV